MVGFEVNKGIIPVTSEELFKQIEAAKSEHKSFEITVSMLEIYNERVQDLLININKRPQGGLKVRENKITGVFVEGLSHHPVNSYAEIESLMALGNTHRSIGSTQMNATSSRAHTIFTIEFKQIELFDDRKIEKLSVINLVDLAGSEKSGQTGATGDRLKEGCAINKSLVVLGTVIECLAEKSQGKNPSAVVPYREAALTRILSNALGGNSKTVMICALSPASVNFEETLSTLRYADRAKKIKNHAIINESVQDRIIRELKEENEDLKKLIEQAGGLEKIRELQEQLEANERLVNERMMSWEEKRQEMRDDFQKVDEISGPHLTNLNEDAQLSGRVKYSFLELPILVGRRNAPCPVQIVLSSSSIRPIHCSFDRNEDGAIVLAPHEEACSEFLYLNGDKVTGPVVLQHLDRIIMGTSTVFMFQDGDPDPELDYEFVVNEKASKQQVDIENTFPAQPLPLPEAEQPVDSQSSQSKRRALHTQLAKLFPLVNEANLIAGDLSRNAKFSVKIMNILPDDVEKEDDLEAENWQKETKVEVVNQDYGLVWLWDVEKFEDRLLMLRELLDEPVVPSPDEDPLWDPPEEALLGKGYYSLKPLGLLFDNPFDILIISTSGGDAGYLKVNIVPTDDAGDALEEGPENPEELIGQLVNFKIEISEAWNLPKTHSNNVYCEYHFPGVGVRRTSAVPGYSDHPVFSYKELFTGVQVDNFLCNYLQRKKLAISVYGTGMAMKLETHRTPQRVPPSHESQRVLARSAEAEMEDNAQKIRESRRQQEQASREEGKKGKKKGDCSMF